MNDAALQSLVSAHLLELVIVAGIVTFAVITLASVICPGWGADCYETPPVFDKATRQWDVDETTTDRLGADGLPGRRQVPGGTHALPQVEHVWCAAHEVEGCNRLVCLFPTTDGLPCWGTVERGCGHVDVVVCDEHRLDACRGCRDDARDDAGVLR